MTEQLKPGTILNRHPLWVPRHAVLLETLSVRCAADYPVCYIAGPMRGYKNYNFDVFNWTAKLLRSRGWEVHNPAENDMKFGSQEDVDRAISEVEQRFPTANPLKLFLRQDLNDILHSDCVFVLPGWQDSQGAIVEVFVARGTGTPVYDFETLEIVTAPVGDFPVVPAALDWGPEERATDPNTGGSKGRKQAVFANIPIYAQVMKARVHGFGIFKYPDSGGAPNWTKGTPWSWMYDAAMRHLLSFWGGETINQESGLPHLAHAAWMIDALMEFEHKKLGTDDRPGW